MHPEEEVPLGNILELDGFRLFVSLGITSFPHNRFLCVEGEGAMDNYM